MYNKKKSPSRACKGFKLVDFFVDFTFFEATKNSLLVDVVDVNIVSRRFNTVLKAMFSCKSEEWFAKNCCSGNCTGNYKMCLMRKSKKGAKQQDKPAFHICLCYIFQLTQKIA